MSILTGIVGILLGLLFGWMLGRPRGPMARIADRADKRRKEWLRQKCKDARTWAEFLNQQYGLDAPDPAEDYTLREYGDGGADYDETDWQEPDADQNAIVRGRCTCGTTAVCPCHQQGYYDNSTSHVAKWDPNAQWTHTARDGQADEWH